jgi:hypothetical protein
MLLILVKYLWNEYTRLHKCYRVQKAQLYLMDFAVSYTVCIKCNLTLISSSFTYNL